MHLLLGAPASGKTTRLLEVAHSYLKRRKRVWWVCLPAQKAFVYRQATLGGAVLGLEVLTSQQVYYRLLAANFQLKPILTGAGRVALTGEALVSPEGDLPNPGEARLFARAIAEAKRYGVRPAEIPSHTPESRRLQRIYTRYEELKTNWGRWDYDDFRFAAVGLIETGKAHLEADLMIVDGFRELSPLELRFLTALGKQIEVRVSLPQVRSGAGELEGWGEKESRGARELGSWGEKDNDFAVSPLPLRPPAPLLNSPLLSSPLQRTYRASNPVSEARWILRSLKRDLALGIRALELAVLAPASRIPALLTLADEYGVPLVDQTASTAAETPEGRLLLELLELPDYPTPSRLLAVPDLVPLGKAALERGLVGREAINRLAAELGMAEEWAGWLERLEPKTNSIAWANELLDSIPETRHSPRRAGLLERAKEADRIATGSSFRSWWGALLHESLEYRRPNGGVALLSPNLASGQRWKKLYLCYAVEGAYGSGEREDYFIPEELRSTLESLIHNANHGLPKRFLGRDHLLLQELKTRADEVIITYPEASQEGPLEPEPHLVKPSANPSSENTLQSSRSVPYLPTMPTASILELAQSNRYQANLGLVVLGKPSIEALRRYNECSLQYWAEQFADTKWENLWWQQLIGELRKADKLVPARLDNLARQFPQAEGWLRHYEAQLSDLSLGFRLEGQGFEAKLDGVLRTGNEAHVYRFLEPQTHPEDADAIVRNRWSERWAAAYLLHAFKGRISKVSLWAWPVLGEPILVYDKPIEKVWSVLERLMGTVQEAGSRFKAGIIVANPGFRCRDCTVRDACREGKVG